MYSRGCFANPGGSQLYKGGSGLPRSPFLKIVLNNALLDLTCALASRKKPDIINRKIQN